MRSKFLLRPLKLLVLLVYSNPLFNPFILYHVGSGTTPAFCSVNCQSAFGACLPRLPPAPPVGSGSLPVHTRCRSPGMIALTFDDGHYLYTQALLNTLRDRGVRASFFLNGGMSLLFNSIPSHSLTLQHL